MVGDSLHVTTHSLFGISLDDKNLELTKLLIDRLEHLSADSTYAHRASGLRGSLLRFVERIEAGDRMNRDDQAQLNQQVENGFEILILSAKEIGASR
jgi:hypothetical protein